MDFNRRGFEEARCFSRFSHNQSRHWDWVFRFKSTRRSSISIKSTLLLTIDDVFIFLSLENVKKEKDRISLLPTNVTNNKLRTYISPRSLRPPRRRKNEEKRLATRFVSRSVAFYGALTSPVYSDCIVADKFQSSTVPVSTLQHNESVQPDEEFRGKKLHASPRNLAFAFIHWQRWVSCL